MRLIDADDLIESFRKCYTGHLGMENSDSMMPFKSICTIINKQTTTYDQDKVVEQLETLRKECEDPMQDYCTDYFIDRAIEIVKGGGVNE